MKIETEAVIKRIHEARTIHELEGIAEVTYAVADLALQESEKLIEETLQSLGQRAVESSEHSVTPENG